MKPVVRILPAPDTCRILALDLSLNSTGWAIAEEGAPVRFGTIKPKTIEDMPRLDFIRWRVLELLAPATHVLVENFSFGSKGQAVYQIGGLAYLIRYCLWQEKVSVTVVSPATVKQFATGAGNAKKEVVMKEVFKRFGIDVATSDEGDAVAISFIGAALMGWWDPTTKHQIETLMKLGWKPGKLWTVGA